MVCAESTGIGFLPPRLVCGLPHSVYKLGQINSKTDRSRHTQDFTMEGSAGYPVTTVFQVAVTGCLV
jgi:hypothetical protein